MLGQGFREGKTWKGLGFKLYRMSLTECKDQVGTSAVSPTGQSLYMLISERKG